MRGDPVALQGNLTYVPPGIRKEKGDVRYEKNFLILHSDHINLCLRLSFKRAGSVSGTPWQGVVQKQLLPLPS